MKGDVAGVMGTTKFAQKLPPQLVGTPQEVTKLTMSLSAASFKSLPLQPDNPAFLCHRTFNFQLDIDGAKPNFFAEFNLATSQLEFYFSQTNYVIPVSKVSKVQIMVMPLMASSPLTTLNTMICLNFDLGWLLADIFSCLSSVKSQELNRVYKGSSGLQWKTPMVTVQQYDKAGSLERVCDQTKAWSIDSYKADAMIDADIENLPYQIQLVGAKSLGNARLKIFDGPQTSVVDEFVLTDQTTSIELKNPAATPFLERNDIWTFSIVQSDCFWLDDPAMVSPLNPSTNPAMHPLRPFEFKISVKWTHCNSNPLTPKTPTFDFKVARNSHHDSAFRKTLLTETQILANFGTHANPLCALVAWFISAIDSTTAVPESDSLAVQFLQVDRASKLGAFEMMTSSKTFNDQVFEFRIQAQMRGTSRLQSVVNRNSIKVKVHLGCFNATSITVTEAEGAMSKVANFGSFSGDRLLLFVPKSSSEIEVNLGDLLKSRTDVASCEPDKVSAFSDQALAVLLPASGVPNARLKINPTLKQGGQLNPVLLFSQASVAFLRFEADGNLGAVSKVVTVAVNECSGVVKPKIDVQAFNFTVGETATTNLKSIFEVAGVEHKVCSGVVFALTTNLSHVIAVNDSSIKFDGQQLSVSGNQPKLLQFWAVATLAQSLSSANVSIIVNVTKANMAPNFVPPIDELEIRCVATQNAFGNFEEGETFVYSSPAAFDAENDGIKIEILGIKHLEFVTANVSMNNFMLKVNRSMLNNSDKFPILVSLSDEKTEPRIVKMSLTIVLKRNKTSDSTATKF